MDGVYEKRAEAMREAKRAKVLELEAMEAKLNGYNKTNTAEVRAKLNDLAVPPLSDADVEGVSLKFNVQLEYMLPGNDRSRSWTTMFEEVDKDKSGLITFNELERMVRDQMKLTVKDDLSSAALQALWCWIDADDSNSVQPAEFGKFMKLAESSNFPSILDNKRETFRQTQSYLLHSNEGRVPISMLQWLRTEQTGLDITVTDNSELQHDDYDFLLNLEVSERSERALRKTRIRTTTRLT